MKRPDILDYPSSQRDQYFDDIEHYCTQLEIGTKAAIAVLTQNKTFPIDVEIAVKWLRESME